MKTVFTYVVAGKQGIWLFVEDRYLSSETIVSVFCFHQMRIAQAMGDHLGLAVPAGAVGSWVDFHEPDDVRRVHPDKVYDFIKFSSSTAKKAGIGKGYVITVVMAGGVTYIIEQKTHDTYYLKGWSNYLPIADDIWKTQIS